MQVRFLLGPAGSGKTSHCLEEVRTALLGSPEGPPLIFLAPKQATFQIERQLLADGRLTGFTRLFIVSFERLAEFILEALDAPAPRLLSDDGRLMVLRALLARKERAGELALFRATARMPGFAQELSKVVRECQRAGAGPVTLRKVAEAIERHIPTHDGKPIGSSSASPLALKLRDIALLFDAYNQWLAAEKLEDADRLLDMATRQLQDTRKNVDSKMARSRILCEGLWMDGFAEMTVQETNLLAAILPWCGKATLAFCCEPAAMAADAGGTAPRFSPWSVVAHTANRCRNAIALVAEIDIVPLRTTPRFQEDSDLAHLERYWSAPVPRPGVPPSVRVVRCDTPDAEVAFAAREICRHVANGGRYRDAALLVREMRRYQDVIRRVFTRYEIPHFLDRRESVAHHPLAELTRFSLRTVARCWRQEDLLGVLKSGLVRGCGDEADWLENEALARGWEGQKWLEPVRLSGEPLIEGRLDEARRKLAEPLQAFQNALVRDTGYGPTGAVLAAALRDLWRAFDVDRQLADWTAEAPDKAVHTTVWEEMQEWLRNMELGFAQEAVRLEDWLPIVEAGLAALSVGVIPPLLDEVLVGSIDRSRNPDLKLAFVLGVNETIFPAVPPAPALLTERERLAIEEHLWLGPGTRHQLAHERFYGYIAFTRARQKLIVTYAQADREGRKRNPSAFIAHLHRLFPDLKEETFPSADTCELLHTSELAVPLIRAAWTASTGDVTPAPATAALLSRFAQLPPPYVSAGRTLAPEIVDKLFPPRLVTSVSRLEEFASCAFRFFVTTGLRAKERLKFEVDARQTGTFQHEVLMDFHNTLRNEQRRWRDVTPGEARALIGRIAMEKLPAFKGGVLTRSGRDRIETQNLIAALQDFVETAIGWAAQYEFDPVAVELDFRDDGRLPAWEISVGNGRALAFTGMIDRVDALIDPVRRVAAIAVMDYKSSAREVDAKLLAAGVQMQLFAYVAALCQLPHAAKLFNVERIIPAGAFYVTLRPVYQGAESRDAVLRGASEARRKAYQHRGRFVRELLHQFDREADTRKKGDQFNYRLTKDGAFHANCREPLAQAEFEKLLAGLEEQLAGMGQRIFSGDIGVNPYRHKDLTACDRCDYATVCRIDRWTHEFRALNGAAEEVEP